MFDYKKPWHVLDVDTTNALNPSFDRDLFLKQSDQFGNSFVIWKLHGDRILDVLDRQWLDHLKTKNIEVGAIMIFYRDAHLVYPEAHIDITHTDSRTHVFAINWVISPNDDSYMTWYDVPVPGPEQIEIDEIKLTPTNDRYYTWNVEDIQDKELARHCIGNKLTLVRTDIPHNVVVNGQPRWAISIRCKTIDVDKYRSWESTVDYFNKTLGLIKS